jgi:small subunit ribosomal protein S15
MSKEKTDRPDWVKTKPEELKKIVVDLAKNGETPARIGLILRDQHGIPKAKLLGKKISQIIKEAKIEVKSEKELTKKKISTLESHSAVHKHDYSAKRSLIKKLWIIHKLDKQAQ